MHSEEEGVYRHWHQLWEVLMLWVRTRIRRRHHGCRVEVRNENNLAMNAHSAIVL